MGKYILLTSIVIMLLLASCDQTKSNNTTAADNDFPLSALEEGEYSDLDAIRAQARGLIDHRASNGDKPMSMLTYGYWNPEFVFDGHEMSAPGRYEGYWIKYEDDFTYSYGAYKNVMGSGRYHFRLDDSQLMMLDNNVDQEPKVWTANNNGEMMSYIGVHEWGVNNGMQMKMVSMDAQPTMAAKIN
ncbi:MAG: hypothetical protein ACI9P5_004175 [Saprospiraceae bacterium]|jgi:hypothetical protein